jgi:hypothetical protein
LRAVNPASQTEASDMTEPKMSESADAADYATSYDKPLLRAKFREGRSGNPLGRRRTTPLRGSVECGDGRARIF